MGKKKLTKKKEKKEIDILLQVALAPELGRYPRRSCPVVKSFAFASHVPCYVRPGSGAPSFCGLSVSDKWEILVTIKSSLGSDFFGTGLAGLQVRPFLLPVYLSTCLPVCLSTCLPVCLSTCLPVYLSACLPVYLSSCLAVFLSACLPV